MAKKKKTSVKAKAKKMKKKMDLTKFRATVKKSHAHHKNWKTKVKEAIANGEHGAAEAAINMLHKSKAAIHDLVSHLETHHAKKKKA